MLPFHLLLYVCNFFFFFNTTGINENNKSLIEWCIDTSASEKKIRHAAKSLFTKINSAHKGVLSKEEYANAINSLTVGHERERKLLLAAGELFFFLQIVHLSVSC